MPVSLSVKGIPDHLAERLRTRASSNHRSLQGELMAILEAAANGAAPVPATDSAPASASASTPRLRGTQTIEEALVDLKRMFPRPVPDPLGAARIVREMRDSRYGESTVQGQPNRHRTSEGRGATRKRK